MINPATKVYVTAVSCRRPKNVPKMEALVGPITWVVKDEQDRDEYTDYGASNVVIGGGLCESRNKALELAFQGNNWCLQLSDDLKKLQMAFEIPSRKMSAEGEKKARDCEIEEAVGAMKQLMLSTGAYLGGVAPTPNLFYFNPRRPVKTAAFIVGDMILVRPTELRFDTQLKLKEDYDYTLQHLQKHGKVARVDTVLATFQHRANAGGAVDFRTAEREQEAIAYLKEKWPGYIRDNPRRPNEILLKLR